jgi:hypothetical protein
MKNISALRTRAIHSARRQAGLLTLSRPRDSMVQWSWHSQDMKTFRWE